MPLNKTTITTENGECRRKVNQFGDYEDVTNMNVDDWGYRWAKEQTKFHVPKEHPMLIKYIDKLTLQRPKQRIFVPLCGKSIDMAWLAKRGHVVIGNEGVDEACRLFFEEQKIPYTTEPLDNIDGCIYKATDGTPISIYRCDCFDITSDLVGKFDCIWDRGSFVALPVADRERYALMIMPLMKADCRYMLDSFLVDHEYFGGPPFNCTEDDVQAAFGKACSVEKLEKKDVFGEWQKSWGVTYFDEEVFMLSLKSTEQHRK